MEKHRAQYQHELKNNILLNSKIPPHIDTAMARESIFKNGKPNDLLAHMEGAGFNREKIIAKHGMSPSMFTLAKILKERKPFYRTAYANE